MPAVLTADVVNSTDLRPPDFRDLIAAQEALLSGQDFEFYRGDSLQAFLPDARAAFRLVLSIRTAARRFNQQYGEGTIDVRCAIGIAAGSVPTDNVRTATGPAFLLSGRAFDALGEGARLTILSGNEEANFSLGLLARFTDHLLHQLTGRQAAVIFELLGNRSQQEVARALGKSPATISQHVHSGAWPELERLLRDYTTLIERYALS
ncbi:hypothetical protein [Flaviaesturariibacter amylovorans]|uniref:Sigma-70 family RNA polymerase sigma factor n=1 Tax=Flaviaesturariibacter amylovorans TaxID=1084520 RepID=A0ABP8GZB4_9BACT